jgi:hypothetical protein
MWAILPPIVLVLVERLSLRSTYVADFITDRLEPAFPVMAGIETQVRASLVTIHRDQVVSLPRLYEQLDATSVFFNWPMLLGLVATAALLCGAIRLRSWRDEG